LGAPSNFTTGFTAPPHYLLAAAGSHGLDFVAVADPALVTPWGDPGAVLHVPAWLWQSGDDQAVVYNGQDEALDGWNALLASLAATGSLAQWQGQNPPVAAAVSAFAADDASAPGDLADLYELWSTTGMPLLPAGNADPPLPGAVNPAPRYTGLATASMDTGSVLEAVAAHRGWLTSAPGLWLTLQAELPGGERIWMGSATPANNQVTLHVYYGDRSGQVAGLAIWQDNKPVRQLDVPSADGRWSISLPAVPNSFFYAVATQADGDFAITAPVRILPGGDGIVVLNEVLPAPAADHNRDGKVDGDDEFIELYNPGTQPVSLAGLQLSDNTGDEDPTRRYTFGVGQYLNGGEWLLIWRKESWINQNVEDDYVRLLNADGEEMDRINWAESPDNGWSISRIPDGQRWVGYTRVTPGGRNARRDEPSGNSAANAAQDDDDEEDPNVIPPTHGQADGPPGSLAHAKLAGLRAQVEFQAVVTVPPGLFNNSIYVADPAPDIVNGPYAGISINVYLFRGEFPPLQEGDRVRVRGTLRSFRGELELQIERPDQIWRMSSGTPLLPLPINAAEVAESLEGRLVTFQGVVSGWQGDSIFLSDPANPDAEPVRVVIRSSLSWRRPYVNRGEVWQVTGVVSQMASAAPWNGGYRVMVRYQTDLVKLKK
jgi:hypothetical protein